MKAKIRTRADLVSDGFKMAGHLWRKGKKHEEDVLEVSLGTVNVLSGQSVEIRGLHSAEKSTVDVFFEEEEFVVPLWLFQVEPNLTKLPKKQKYSIGRGDFVEFNFGKFTFPCDVRELNVSEVRKLAQWVLKVSK